MTAPPSGHSPRRDRSTTDAVSEREDTGHAPGPSIARNHSIVTHVGDGNAWMPKRRNSIGLELEVS
ncbi:MAG: hypothetical protein F4051_12275 [Boseongicola sp. SB0670_bin_30]|nr:hypothetical protein [Boseongicola sp. SB0670_bin_30]